MADCIKVEKAEIGEEIKQLGIKMFEELSAECQCVIALPKEQLNIILTKLASIDLQKMDPATEYFIKLLIEPSFKIIKVDGYKVMKFLPQPGPLQHVEKEMQIAFEQYNNFILETNGFEPKKILQKLQDALDFGPTSDVLVRNFDITNVCYRILLGLKFVSIKRTTVALENQDASNCLSSNLPSLMSVCIKKPQKNLRFAYDSSVVSLPSISSSSHSSASVALRSCIKKK